MRNARAKAAGLCGRHAPKQWLSNVAIRSRMIKLYPRRRSATCSGSGSGGAQNVQRYRLHIPRKASCEEVACRARIRVEDVCWRKYVAATPLQIRDNAIGDCVVATVAAIKRYQKTGRAASLYFRSRKGRVAEHQAIHALPARRCSTNNRPRLFQMYASHEAHPAPRRTSRPSAHARWS